MYWKIKQILLQYGAAVLYCKAGQVVFEIIAGITQWDNFYDKVGAVLQSMATLYYKVG